MHNDVRRTTVLAHLHFAVVRYREGDLITGLRTRRDVFGDYPILGTIQEQVAIIRQVVRRQPRGVARGQTQCEGAYVHGLGGEDLHDQPFAQQQRSTREGVAVTEFRVGARRHALLVAEADVPAPSAAKENQETVTGRRSLMMGVLGNHEKWTAN